MSAAELTQKALELPPEETEAAIAEGVRRIEDLMTGRVKGMTEEEFRAALQ